MCNRHFALNINHENKISNFSLLILRSFTSIKNFNHPTISGQSTPLLKHKMRNDLYDIT